MLIPAVGGTPALNLGHFGVKLKYSPDGGTTWEDRACRRILKVRRSRPATASHCRRGAETDLVFGRRAANPAGSGPAPLPAASSTPTTAAQSWTPRPSRSGTARPHQVVRRRLRLPGIHSIAATRPTRAAPRIGISCGGVWRTDDDGRRGSCRGHRHAADYMPPEQQYEPSIQDPHRLVHAPSAPEHLWVQHHNGVFRSRGRRRAGPRSTKREARAVRFAVAVHPHDPQRRGSSRPEGRVRASPWTADRRHPHPRRRQNLRRARRGPAAGARLRHRVPPLPRRRRHRPAPSPLARRLAALGQRRRRRFVDDREHDAAADSCRTRCQANGRCQPAGECPRLSPTRTGRRYGCSPRPE